VSASFPEPDECARDVSARLTERIRQDVEAAGGWIGFEHYMRQALYEPGLGYYHNGSVKFGAQGDFVTAPELSSLFAGTIARELHRILASLRDPVVLELGAGSGRLAGDLLRALESLGVEPRYWILEPSAELRERQREHLASRGDNIRWLDRLPPEPFEGVILANEVLDAFPVSCFTKRGGETRPMGVAWEADEFAWAEGDPTEALSRSVAALETGLGGVLPEGFRSEISPSLPAWIRSVSEPLARGAVLIVDYGLSRREYYHPQRSRGTLVCHYRHRAHADPFLYPGLQDITAWVDFSACAEAAREAGMEVAGFTTQGQFLIEGGAAELLAQLSESRVLAEAQALKTLVLPGEMGERFKLALFTRGLALDPPPGRDFRDRL